MTGETAPRQAEKQRWQVVGGVHTDGIIVRKRSSLDSPEEQWRLSHGAVVEQLQMRGGRLCYRLLVGVGPEQGWVSLKLGQTKLVVKDDKRSGPKAAKVMPANQAASQAQITRTSKSMHAAAHPVSADAKQGPQSERAQASPFIWASRMEDNADLPLPTRIKLSRANIDHVCKLHGYRVVPVRADGNCQFRAVAHHLLGDEESNMYVRQRVVQWLLAHARNYDKSEMLEGKTIEQYCADMLVETDAGPVWGDFLTLQAVADMEKAPITVLSSHPTEPIRTITPAYQQTSKPIVLTYIVQMHYDAAVPDEHSQFETVQTFPFQSSFTRTHLELLE